MCGEMGTCILDSADLLLLSSKMYLRVRGRAPVVSMPHSPDCHASDHSGGQKAVVGHCPADDQHRREELLLVATLQHVNAYPCISGGLLVEFVTTSMGTGNDVRRTMS
jgi:hypothetical protein